MAPLLLKVKGNKSFSPFSNLTDEDSLTRTWRVCTKVAAHLEQGQRLENLSWRLWYLHDLMVENNDTKSKRDFKRLSRTTGEKLDRDKGRSIEQLTAPGFRRTDSGDVVRRKAAEREKLRALAVAKLHGKFKGKQSMKDMQYTFALDPKVNFKGPAGKATHERTDSVISTTGASDVVGLEPESSREAAESRLDCSSEDNAMDTAADTTMFDVSSGEIKTEMPSETSSTSGFGAVGGGLYDWALGSSYKLEDIEAAERELLANQIDLDAPLETLLASLEGLEDVQMDLSDIGIAAGTELPNFKAPFGPDGEHFDNFAAPQPPQNHQQPTEGRSRQASVAARPKVTKKQRKTDPQQQKAAADMVRKKAEELRVARKLADATQRTHIHSGGSEQKQDARIGGSDASAFSQIPWAFPGHGPVQSQQNWSPVEQSSGYGPTEQSAFSQALNMMQSGNFGRPGFAPDFSAMASATESAHTFENAANAPLHISTSLPSNGSASSSVTTGTSLSTPSTPLLADHLTLPTAQVSSSNRSVNSLSAPTSPTLRPALGSIGRSGSSPGPVGVADSNTKRHSTDGIDQITKPRGRGRRSLIGPNAFTAINPAAERKSLSSDSHPPAAQCTNCGATSTPLWRRDPNDLLLCNACGLYLKLHKTPRPKSLKNNHHGHSHSGHATPSATPGGASAPGSRNVSPSRAGSPSAEEMMSCFNCGTYTTPLWRKDDAGHTVCNACGLYLKLHHEHRPATMRADVIKKRSRYDEKRGRASAASSRRSSPQPSGSTDSVPVTAADAAVSAKVEPALGLNIAPRGFGDAQLQPQQQDYQQGRSVGVAFEPPKMEEDTNVCWSNAPFPALGSGGNSSSSAAFAAIVAQFGMGLANLSSQQQQPPAQRPGSQLSSGGSDTQSSFPGDLTSLQAMMQSHQAAIAAQATLTHNQPQQQQAHSQQQQTHQQAQPTPNYLAGGQMSDVSSFGNDSSGQDASSYPHTTVTNLAGASSGVSFTSPRYGFDTPVPSLAQSQTPASVAGGQAANARAGEVFHPDPGLASSNHEDHPSTAASEAPGTPAAVSMPKDVDADTPQAGSWW